jgi:hypothetical protein
VEKDRGVLKSFENYIKITIHKIGFIKIPFILMVEAHVSSAYSDFGTRVVCHTRVVIPA